MYVWRVVTLAYESNRFFSIDDAQCIGYFDQDSFCNPNLMCRLNTWEKLSRYSMIPIFAIDESEDKSGVQKQSLIIHEASPSIVWASHTNNDRAPMTSPRALQSFL